MRSRIVGVLDDFFQTQLFGNLVPTSEVVYALMFTVLIVIYIRRCKTAGLDRYHGAGIALWCSIGAIAGGRLFYLVQHLPYTLEYPSTILEVNGGLVSFGGYIGCAAGVVLYARSRAVDVWPYSDTLASMVGLGPCIGRMACLLNGDDYGSVSTVPWAIRYPNGSMPFVDHLNRGLVKPYDELSVAVHPVQVYESLLGLIMFVWFTFLWRHHSLKPGVLTILFWIVYGAGRFVIEFYRGDQNRGWVGPLSVGQAVCLVMIASGVAALAYRYRFRMGAMKTA